VTRKIAHISSDGRRSIKHPLLLVIDDDAQFQGQIALLLQNFYQVEARLEVAAVDSIALTDADTIILDLNMPGIDGVTFIKTIASLDPKPKLLIASGHDESILELAKKTASMYGVYRTQVLQKPITRAKLLQALSQLDLMPLEGRVRSGLQQTFSEQEICAGLSAGQFSLIYQPQVSLISNAVIGLEALARWDHPGHGRLSPAYFIAQLEDSLDAEAFTLTIAEMAIKDILELENLSGAQLKVSINVPPSVLESDSFIDELMRQLAEQGLPPERFQCEITERGLENTSPTASASLLRLRMKGVQLSIDDFGIGQSGLSKLKTRAFNEIKIDKSFIQDLPSSRNSRSIVESMIQLSRLLGLRVVAEGVEDEITLTHSKMLGIENAQGCFFARPMSIDQMPQWLNQWGSQ